MGIKVKDKTGVMKSIQFANHQSVAKINLKENKCRLPMKLDRGWNYLNIDLENVVSKAFGASYEHTRTITIKAQCRIWRVYFQNREYADVELPKLLRMSGGQ